MAEPQRKAFSVSAVLGRVKEILDERVKPVWIRGEVAGWKVYPSGHAYFTLKDAQSQLRCVMFARDLRRLPTLPKDGTEILAYGSVSAYPQRGELQLVAQSIETTNAGGLWQLAYEALRAKLDAEGLFDARRKRAIPLHPECVGVVTSRAGAVFHDITRVVERRAPWTQIVFSPCRVQGDGAAEDIARAIECFGRRRCADVLIVGRGGGSLEDLWAFNTEPVARAIAASPVPVISAVGHETDTTIADFVADLRAPTPSAAAERAVPDAQEIARRLEDSRGQMATTLRRTLEELARMLDDTPARMEGAIRRHFERAEREVAVLHDRATRQLQSSVRLQRERAFGLSGHLESLSPLAALRRGFAVATDADGRALRDAADVAAGERIRLRLAAGSLTATVDAVDPTDTLEYPDEE